MLTNEQIDAMPAGAEMDALIAERVMGWRPPSGGLPEGRWESLPESNARSLAKITGMRHVATKQEVTLEEWRSAFHWRDERGGCWHGPAAYSTEIAAAWLVVEKLRPTHGFWIDGDGDNEDIYNLGYEVDFQHGMPGSPGFSKGTATSDSAPLAICRAALKAARKGGSK